MRKFLFVFFILLIFNNLNVFSASSIDSIKFQNYLKIGIEFQNSNLDSSRYYFDKIIENSKNKILWEFRAEALKQIGVCYFYENNFEKSLLFYNQAIELRKKNILSRNNLIAIANLLHNIALINNYMGNNEKALNNQYESEKIRLKIKDNKGLATFTYPNIAAIFLEQGNYSKSQEYFYKTLKINEKLKNFEGIADSYDNLGVIFEAKTEYNEALKNYEKSFEIRKKLGKNELLSYSYNNIGVAYFHLNNFEKALFYYQKSLEIKTQLNDKRGIGNTYNNLGLVFENLKKYEKSLSYFEKSIEIKQELSDLYGLTASLTNAGRALFHLNKTNEALNFLLKSYDLAKLNNYNDLLKDVSGNLALVYKNQQNFEKAYEMLLIHKQMSDSLFNENLIKRLTVIEMQYEFDNKQSRDSIKIAEKIFKTELQNKEKLKRERIINFSFLIILFIIVILVIVIFRSFKHKQLAKQNELKHKSAEIEKSLLRSQMNPHFIFNSMNSIQNFISQNDTYSAERFLSKFASLIRLILENTQQSYICLSDELNSLKIYLELEQLRFNKKFEFEFQIDENIEDEFIYVPPMLIQPYVENAILHGILNKTENGKIIIELKIDEQKKVLFCSIIDDGVGRAKANEIKLSQKTTRKSIGMQLTQERLKHLNSESETLISVEIIDLYNENQNPKGTQVNIVIPFKEN
jgi:tetratricopeptide (TPR) repeat protein